MSPPWLPIAVLAALSSATLSVGGCDDESATENCCRAAPRCPTGSVSVSACEISGCFTVEAGCCESQTCVPEADCLRACLPFETQVESCTDATPGIACRRIDGCGVYLYCESQCTAIPGCDPGDQAAETAGCPSAACYESAACGNVVLCIDNDPPHQGGGVIDRGGGGAGESGGGGGDGGRGGAR